MTKVRKMDILVLRHAKPCESGLCYGQMDVEVELAAVMAAQSVATNWPDLAASVKVIWTSPLQRTSQLAQALGEQLQREVRTDPRLTELCFGQWEGRRWDEIHRTDAAQLDRWATNCMCSSPPNGESGLDLCKRVAAWLKDELSEGILAVTHAGPIRVLRAMAQDRFDMRTATLDFGRQVDHLAVEAIAVSPASVRR